MDKKEIRRQMKQLNLALDTQARAEASRRIFEAVERLPQFSAARTIALFSSLADEPDTTYVLERWSRTKQIVVPRVEGDVMQLYNFDPVAMKQGSFGIAEPQHCDLCTPSQIDLIIVPGTAFSRTADRMGRGKGFYDKYMSDTTFRAFKAGVCYPHQLLDQLPVEPHDVPLDCVVCGED